MIGLQKKTNLPIAAVRATLEITVVSIGWYLGGTSWNWNFIICFWNWPLCCFRLYLLIKF